MITNLDNNYVKWYVIVINFFICSSISYLGTHLLMQVLVLDTTSQWK